MGLMKKVNFFLTQSWTPGKKLWLLERMLDLTLNWVNYPNGIFDIFLQELIRETKKFPWNLDSKYFP